MNMEEIAGIPAKIARLNEINDLLVGNAVALQKKAEAERDKWKAKSDAMWETLLATQGKVDRCLATLERISGPCKWHRREGEGCICAPCLAREALQKESEGK